MSKFDRLAGFFLAVILLSVIMNFVLYSILDDGTSSFDPGIMKQHYSEVARLYHQKFQENHKGDVTKDVKVNENENGDANSIPDNSQHLDGQKSELAEQIEEEKPISEQTNNDNDNNSDRIIEILQKSGMNPTPEIISQLPTWSEVKSLYGSTPHIIGLDTCADFQSTIPKEDAYVGPAGIFNTGTNLLADLILQYCTLPQREKAHPNAGQKRKKGGMLWQVPWGKHNPVSWRTKHKAVVGSKGVEQTHVLPVVTIKDPFTWMGSMCRHEYAMNWYHSKEHCPNLVPNEHDYGHRGITEDSDTVPVRVAYQQDKVEKYDSMVDVWNTWYGNYLNAEVPRLVIRFEDILFHPAEVLTQVCHCAGGELINDEDGIHLMSESAKQGGSHSGASGLLSAIKRYGKREHRFDGMTAEDFEYAKENVSSNLMEMFGYAYPDKKVVE